MTKDTVVQLIEALSLIVIFLADKYLGGLVGDLVKALCLAFQPFFIKWLAKWLGVELALAVGKYFR